MNGRVDQTLRAAIAAGLLPPSATGPRAEKRPWPVVLLTALGAWLAAIPLLGVVGLLLGDLMRRGAGPYFVGVLLLVGAAVVLRARELPAFVEQLAIPALLVGGGSLGFGLSRDLPAQLGAAALSLIALGLGVLLERGWLRVLLGAAAAALAVFALMPRGLGADALWRGWLAVHGAFALWLAAQYWLARATLASARTAAFVECCGAGWGLAVLASLAWWSGMTFLLGANLGGGPSAELARELAMRRDGSVNWRAIQAGSVLLSAAATAIAARAWPSLRRPLGLGMAGLLTVLAAFLPALGGVWLALALYAVSQRWRLAVAAALAAAWIIGSFYYQLHWTLAMKAGVLAAIGAGLALLGAPALLHQRARRSVTGSAAAGRAAPLLIALSALAGLFVVNLGIGQKERLIAHGQAVFVALAPVDPRSLMQGDYMRLNFNVPQNVARRLDGLISLRRPQVVARRDARGVATLLRIDDGTPLAADETRIQLTPKDGRWILVSDAWFFREGQAQRWAAAKFAEFRVDEEGKALLVGLADGELNAIRQ